MVDIFALSICGLAAVALGCGSDSSEKLMPVTGRVTIDGRPLTTGAVSFRSDPGRGNGTWHHPTGEIDADGNYELYTVVKPGAPPGWYKVLVFAAEQTGDSPHGSPAMPKWLVNAKYIDERTTDLSLEVVENPAPGAYDLKLSK